MICFLFLASLCTGKHKLLGIQPFLNDVFFFHSQVSLLYKAWLVVAKVGPCLRNMDIITWFPCSINSADWCLHHLQRQAK